MQSNRSSGVDTEFETKLMHNKLFEAGQTLYRRHGINEKLVLTIQTLYPSSVRTITILSPFVRARMRCSIKTGPEMTSLDGSICQKPMTAELLDQAATKGLNQLVPSGHRDRWFIPGRESCNRSAFAFVLQPYARSQERHAGDLFRGKQHQFDIYGGTHGVA